MSYAEDMEVKRMLEARNAGYGEGQLNRLSHDRWVLVIETDKYYHAEARLKKDIPAVLHWAMGGIYFRIAKIKAPNSNTFQSYAEVFGAIPEHKSFTELEAEAAGALEKARGADYQPDPMIHDIKGGIKLGRKGAYGTLGVLLVVLIVLWYFLLGNIRKG